MERSQTPDFPKKYNFQCNNCTLPCSDNIITNPYDVANIFRLSYT